MKKLRLALFIAGGLLAGLSAHATPYASCITNSGNTIYFDLNEAGGNVTVSYEDGSTNANFNGSTTGLNLPAGYQNFSLTGHSGYKISVFKSGTGAPSVTTTIARGTGRGLAVNRNGNSRYFGYVYSAIGGAGVVMQNADGTGADGAIGSTLNASGLNPAGFWGATTYSPNKLDVAPDDYVIVGDFSKASGGVSRIDPTFSTGTLLLDGQGQVGNHGSAESKPILTGTIGVDAKLFVVDGSFVSPYNQIFQYNLGNGALPWTAQPDVIGTNINPSGLIGYNDSGGFGFYAGLSRASNGYFYATVQRQNHSNPNLQVYDTDGKTLLWSSYFKRNGTNADWLLDITPQLAENLSAPSDSALSPDGRYLAIVHLDNHFTILTMTNDISGGGIPDITTAYLFAGPGTAGNGRGIAWDAAGNLWMSSSGLGSVYQYSLGRTATTITSGNINGPTNFTLLAPTEADIAPPQSVAAQSNTYGYPTSATNVITRNGDVSSAGIVKFTVGGTAAAGTYTLSAANSVQFAAGQTSTNIIITPVSDGIARPTTTVVITLVTNGTSQYNVGFQNQATTFIVNTATPQVVVTPGAASMYNAFSNDYTSVVLTRWGDTNTAFTTGSVVFGGSAVSGTDYAPLTTTASFAAGDITKTVRVAKPLVNGQPPVHTANGTYVGNKTFTATVQSGSGYNTYSSNNVATLTIVDSAYPPTTVLYSNPLTDPNDFSNWNITALAGDQSAAPDYNVDFGYDLTANNGASGNNGLIPLPPSGATAALRMTTAKQFGGQANVVNAYLTSQNLSGDYAVRFNMYIVEGQNVAAAAEGPLFGINHDGLETNWWYGAGTLTGGPWSADGVWYCGFNSRKSFGGNSYFVQHPAGNWLVDSPRFVEHLAARFAEMGG
ncbi:MAG: Calx-beta domain-containing protein, partial [Limisphaerales bacterium]